MSFKEPTKSVIQHDQHRTRSCRHQRMNIQKPASVPLRLNNKRSGPRRSVPVARSAQSTRPRRGRGRPSPRAINIPRVYEWCRGRNHRRTFFFMNSDASSSHGIINRNTSEPRWPLPGLRWVRLKIFSD